ncbi:MAG: hypothetical protein R2867_17885 [Caldilineaceae bacterium]
MQPGKGAAAARSPGGDGAFCPALGLQDDPAAATRLIEQAALARGMRVPVTVTVQRTIQTAVQTQSKERIAPLPALPTTLIGRGPWSISSVID